MGLIMDMKELIKLAEQGNDQAIKLLIEMGVLHASTIKRAA